MKIYKITCVRSHKTYINEYWDDLLIFKYIVNAVYRGGDIEEFMNNNSFFRNPNFDGIDEYHRRTFILDF